VPWSSSTLNGQLHHTTRKLNKLLPSPSRLTLAVNEPPLSQHTFTQRIRNRQGYSTTCPMQRKSTVPSDRSGLSSNTWLHPVSYRRRNYNPSKLNCLYVIFFTHVPSSAQYKETKRKRKRREPCIVLDVLHRLTSHVCVCFSCSNQMVNNLHM